MTIGQKKNTVSQAARDAALIKRRELAALKTIVAVEVFVVRCSAPSLLYGWEIRKFGSIVLSRSETGFPTSSLARIAGEEALSAVT